MEFLDFYFIYWTVLHCACNSFADNEDGRKETVKIIVESGKLDINVIDVL